MPAEYHIGAGSCGVKPRAVYADIRIVRPRYIKETSAAMLALSIAWLFQLNSTMTIRQVEMVAVAFAVRCAVTWAYWTGRNWARAVALMYSAFCLVRLLQWSQVTMLTRELWMCEAALSIFLMVYLPQRELNAWFTRSEPAAAPVESAPAQPDPLSPDFVLQLERLTAYPLPGEPERVTGTAQEEEPLTQVMVAEAEAPIPEAVYAEPEPAADAPAPVSDRPARVRRGLQVRVVIRLGQCSWIRVVGA